MSDIRVYTVMYHNVYDVSNKKSGINLDSNYPYKKKKEAFEEQIKALSEFVGVHGVGRFELKIKSAELRVVTLMLNSDFRLNGERGVV